jgi:hypothetical protein
MNRALHAITNRANDFTSPVFPTTSTYAPVTLPKAAQSVRDFLQLGGDDYFVVGVLMALYSFPELLENIDDGLTFRLTDYVRPPDTGISTLLPDSNGPPYLYRVPVEFPVSLTYQLSYGSANFLQVALGSKTFNVPVTVSGTQLLPVWPPELGISGSFDLTYQPWNSAFALTIQHVPVGYPYELVASILDQNTQKNELLVTHGLLSHYFRARSGMEKVATVALALGLSNPYYA